MKKMAWGLGVAAALALVAGQARAQSSTQSGSTNDNSATHPSGNTTDNSAGSMGTGSGSMGTGSGSMNSGSGSTSSGASASTDPSTSSTSGHFDALTGKVERFDRSNNELTLAGSDRKLKLDSSTKVMRDGSRASIDDIKEGDQVRASYSGAGDTLQVKSLDITSAGSMGSTPTTTKKSAPHGGANAPSGNSGDSASPDTTGGNAPSGNSSPSGTK
jgi:Cu/Ag efflux protein CusF